MIKLLLWLCENTPVGGTWTFWAWPLLRDGATVALGQWIRSLTLKSSSQWLPFGYVVHVGFVVYPKAPPRFGLGTWAYPKALTQASVWVCAMFCLGGYVILLRGELHWSLWVCVAWLWCRNLPNSVLNGTASAPQHLAADMGVSKNQGHPIWT